MRGRPQKKNNISSYMRSVPELEMARSKKPQAKYGGRTTKRFRLAEWRQHDGWHGVYGFWGMAAGYLADLFSARQHAIACYMSVRLSVTRVDQSKTVEVRITQPSPQSSPMISFLTLNFTVKFQREHKERGRRIAEGYEKYAIFNK